MAVKASIFNERDCLRFHEVYIVVMMFLEMRVRVKICLNAETSNCKNIRKGVFLF